MLELLITAWLRQASPQVATHPSSHYHDFALWAEFARFNIRRPHGDEFMQALAKSTDALSRPVDPCFA